MTLTINRKAYGDLLAEIQPQVITNDVENEIALRNIERLLAIPQPTAEEESILQLLLTLVEKYEDEHYPMNDASPLDILLHLMESNNLKQADLVNVIGSSGVVSEVVNGKRQISKNQAQTLGKFFNVDLKLFL
ncbi:MULTISPECIES: helix-turn-helix domain-containing protein [Pseudanabaena]|uniref:helix-turn-helix domain-containing protein n=1 Tax=Pseudanabaena TaxID=1152 RepID=UPI00247A8F67|nr:MULTISPECIES: transcriptional regulator [Pseudanabaena]MEA5485512.1 transcriptional regulator [Pseudanabaena sp. CCNP1317]WGS70651.1 transcriptional regulator [Pseudanabaena galeata CCNP1313]